MAKVVIERCGLDGSRVLILRGDTRVGADVSEQSAFIDFLRGKREAEEKHTTEDWDAERGTWLSELTALMQQLNTWLAPAIQAGLLETRDEHVSVTEEHLGEYKAPSLVILGPGGIRACVAPVGRFVIGAKGRVDLRSGAQKTILLRDESGAWMGVVPRTRKPELVPLTQELFFLLLRRLLE